MMMMMRVVYRVVCRDDKTRLKLFIKPDKVYNIESESMS